MPSKNRHSRRQRGEAPTKIGDTRDFTECSKSRGLQKRCPTIHEKILNLAKNGEKPANELIDEYVKKTGFTRERFHETLQAYKTDLLHRKLKEVAENYDEDLVDTNRLFDFPTQLPLKAQILCETAFSHRHKIMAPARLFIAQETGADEDQVTNWFSRARNAEIIKEMDQNKDNPEEKDEPIVQLPAEILQLCERQFQRFPYFNTKFYTEQLKVLGQSSFHVRKWFRQRNIMERKACRKRFEYTEFHYPCEDKNRHLLNHQKKWPETWLFLKTFAEKGIRPTNEQAEDISNTIGLKANPAILVKMIREHEKTVDKADVEELINGFEVDNDDFRHSKSLNAQNEAVLQLLFDKSAKRGIAKYMVCPDQIELVREHFPRLPEKKIDEWFRKARRLFNKKNKGNSSEDSGDGNHEESDREAGKESDSESFESENPDEPSSSTTQRRLRSGRQLRDSSGEEEESDYDEPVTTRSTKRAGRIREASGTSRPNGNGAKKARTEPTDDSEDSGAAGSLRLARTEQRVNEDSRGRRTESPDEFDEHWNQRDRSEGSGAAGPSSSSGVKRRRSPGSENRNPRLAKSSRPIGNTDQDHRNLEFEVDTHPMEAFDDVLFGNREFDAPRARQLEMPIPEGPSSSKPIEDQLNDLFNGPEVHSLAQAVVRTTRTLDVVTMNKTIQMLNTNFRNLLQHYNNEEIARMDEFRGSARQNLNLNGNQEERAPEDVNHQNPEVLEEEDAPEVEAQEENAVEAPEDTEEAPENHEHLADDVDAREKKKKIVKFMKSAEYLNVAAKLAGIAGNCERGFRMVLKEYDPDEEEEDSEDSEDDENGEDSEDSEDSDDSEEGEENQEDQDLEDSEDSEDSEDDVDPED